MAWGHKGIVTPHEYSDLYYRYAAVAVHGRQGGSPWAPHLRSIPSRKQGLLLLLPKQEPASAHHVQARRQVQPTTHLHTPATINARHTTLHARSWGDIYRSFSPRDVVFSGWVGDQDPTFDGLKNALMNIFHSAWRNYVNFGSDIGTDCHSFVPAIIDQSRDNLVPVGCVVCQVVSELTDLLRSEGPRSCS